MGRECVEPGMRSHASHRFMGAPRPKGWGAACGVEGGPNQNTQLSTSLLLVQPVRDEVSGRAFGDSGQEWLRSGVVGSGRLHASQDRSRDLL